FVHHFHVRCLYLPSLPTRRSSDLEFELSFLDHVRRLREAQLRRTVGRWDGRTVRRLVGRLAIGIAAGVIEMEMGIDHAGGNTYRDRKSTRLNSSHVEISYGVFCLK